MMYDSTTSARRLQARMTKNAKRQGKKHEKGNENPTPDKVWFQNRMKELGLQVGDVADYFSTYPAMVWRMSTARRRVQIPEMIKWAKLLRVPFTVIVQKFGFEVPAQTVPVVGLVVETGRINRIPPGKQPQIDAPVDAASNLKALLIDRPHDPDGMWNGSYLYYEETPGVVRADAFGRLSVIEQDDERAPLLGVPERGPRGAISVVAFESTEIIDLDTERKDSPVKRPLMLTPIKWIRNG